MGRLSNDAKAEKARQVLIDTIAKISDLEPTLGGKWQRNMVRYYQNRLAVLLLYQCGFRNPSQYAIAYLTDRIADTLDQNGGDGI